MSDVSVNPILKQLQPIVSDRWPGASVESFDIVQSLWNDYGAIARLRMSSPAPATLIAKVVDTQGSDHHPRGWNTDASHQRKCRSYQVEQYFYERLSRRCKTSCRVPVCYAAVTDGDAVVLLLEDLDEQYPRRMGGLSLSTAHHCLTWLASFHAEFMGIDDAGVWECGTYWHLATRADEYQAMPAGRLKQAATKLDDLLNGCEFQTLLHGDAKVANFCFSDELDAVSAVDFQYTGRGCGMRDVAYFLGSCLDESTLAAQEAALLDGYFSALSSQPNIDGDAVAAEWRELYAVAGADFHRFLLGWSPGHRKLTGYSEDLVTRALRTVDRNS